MTLPEQAQILEQAEYRLYLPQAFNISNAGTLHEVNNDMNDKYTVYLSTNYKELYIFFHFLAFNLPKTVASKSETVMNNNPCHITKIYTVQIAPNEEPILFYEKYYEEIGLNFVFMAMTPTFNFLTSNPVG